MKITTDSGVVSINRKTPYGKFVMGYMESGAWSGWWTLQNTWNTQKGKKPVNCSWMAWGFICGSIINPLYSEINDLKEELGRL